MADIDDVVSLPRSLVGGVLRALWWLAWDFGVCTIGWSIGWLAWRVVTLGRFPVEGIGGADEAPAGRALVVELTGLVLLAIAVWRVTAQWPDFIG